MVVTILDFITAMLDEDEQIARATFCDAEYGYSWPNAKGERRTPELIHTRRHDPGRVLREVALKRAILEDLEPLAEHGDWQSSGCALNALISMANIWSDHPDFDPRWAI